MKAAMAWGAVMVWSGSALAQVPGPQPGAGGTAPVPATAPPAAGGAGAAAAGTEAAPTTNAPPAEPPPLQTAPPAPPQALPEEEEEPPPPRRRRRRPLDFPAPPEDEEAPRSRRDFRLVDSHFIISAERMTSVLGHSFTIEQETQTIDPFTGLPTATSTREVKHTGADVTFLGGGTADNNPFVVPRLAFDGMLQNGLTLGGSIGYFVASGEREAPSTDGFGSSVTLKEETPTTTVFLFAPRLGVMLQASPKIGIWLRGGVTRLSATTESTDTDIDGNTTTAESTVTLVDITFDPQLVIAPVPHVGLLIGAAIDVGATGTVESTFNGRKEEDGLTGTSYGITAGLAAIF